MSSFWKRSACIACAAAAALALNGCGKSTETVPTAEEIITLPTAPAAEDTVPTTNPMELVEELTVEMEAGDVLLLCSDGLTGHVPDLRIRDVLKKMKDPQAACEKLIEYALGGGGHDNITVAIVWNEGGEEQ